MFIEKQNIATKSFLANISGPLWKILSVFTAETTTAALELIYLKKKKYIKDLWG